MSLVLQSSGGGQITIAEPATASNFTQTLPATTGNVMISPQALTIPDAAGTVMVSGNQPAFRAFLPSSQTVSNATDTKVTLTTEAFDTASRFNNTGSAVGGIPAYAFLPNVAGYYQINAIVGANATTSLTYNYIQIRKNGSSDSIAIYPPYSTVTQYGSLSSLIFLNGTTDYVELFVQLAGVGTFTVQSGAVVTAMSGSLVRAA
jgi:hypothetical protein